LPNFLDQHAPSELQFLCHAKFFLFRVTGFGMCPLVGSAGVSRSSRFDVRLETADARIHRRPESVDSRHASESHGIRSVAQCSGIWRNDHFTNRPARRKCSCRQPPGGCRSWTAIESYTAVTISATLEGAGPDPGIAFLTTNIGPGTTACSEVAVSNFVFPEIDTSPGAKVQLFSGLTLPAGTYYLVLGSSTPAGGGWLSTTAPAITADVGVTAGLDYSTLSGAVNAAYPPGSSFTVSPNTFMFDVTGTAVPEPQSLAYVGV